MSASMTVVKVKGVMKVSVYRVVVRGVHQMSHSVQTMYVYRGVYSMSAKVTESVAPQLGVLIYVMGLVVKKAKYVMTESAVLPKTVRLLAVLMESDVA